MPAASEALLAKLRQGLAAVDWFVVTAPWGDPIFQAQVNDAAIEKGEMDIVYDNATGNWFDVEPGMTLWVGTVAGSRNVGAVRIRSITPPTIHVAENSDIAWDNDYYLTVPGEAGFREPWGVLPRLTEAGGTVTFYKDYDKVYSNEGTHLPPKANAGPPAIGEIQPATGIATLQWIGEDSYATEIGETLTNYVWTFPGGNPATSALQGTRAAPISVVWHSPGFRYVRLDVVDSLGTTGTTFIPTWIGYDHQFYNKVELTSFTASHDAFRIGLRVFGVDPIDFSERSLVGLGIRSWYGGSREELGGYPHRENLFASGWLVGSTITYDARNQQIEFEIESTTDVMKALPGFSYYLEDDSTPTTWYQMDQPTADRMKHHHLEYHTTVNQICHVNQGGEGLDRLVTRRGFPDTNPYDQVQQHLYAGCEMVMLTARQGVIQVQRNPQMMDWPDRNAAVTVMTIRSSDIASDWLEDIDVVVRHRPEIGDLELGGFHGDAPLISRAPGIAPSQSEGSARLNEYILVDQDEANLWAGLEWSRKAYRWVEVHITMRGLWPIFEPARMEKVVCGFVDPWQIGPAENIQCVVREVNMDMHPNLNTALTELVVEPLCTVIEGDTVTIPDAPEPEEPYYPPISVLPPGYRQGELQKVILRTTQGIFVTETFHNSNANVVWEASNTNLSTDQKESVRDMAFDFNHGERLFIISDKTGQLATDGGLFRCQDIWDQAAWERRFDNDYPYIYICDLNDGLCSQGSAGCDGSDDVGMWMALDCDPTNGNIIAVGGHGDEVGARSCRQHKRSFYSLDALETINCTVNGRLHPSRRSTQIWSGCISYGAGYALYTHKCSWGSAGDRHRSWSANAGESVTALNGLVWNLGSVIYHSRVERIVIMWTGDTEIAISFTYGSGWGLYDVLPQDPHEHGHSLELHFLDPRRVMYVDELYDIHYSSDYGYTWGDCPTSPPGAWCLASCADPYRFGDGDGFILGCEEPIDDTRWILLTDDFGQTWTNKTGNLGDYLNNASDRIEQIIPVQNE